VARGAWCFRNSAEPTAPHGRRQHRQALERRRAGDASSLPRGPAPAARAPRFPLRRRERPLATRCSRVP